MSSKKLNIALLAGGDSSERAISIDSAAQVAGALDRSKYNILMVDVDGAQWSHTDSAGRVTLLDRNDFSIEVQGVKIALDYALIMIHGSPGEDGKLQGYLDMMGVSYSSCGMVSSVITFDKVATKRAVSGEGIPLAREVLIRRGDRVEVQDVVARLGLPLFVKPNASGSSCGVTRVTELGELLPAIEVAFGQSDAVLIEESIVGREVGCGVMITAEREYLFPVTEIISKKSFFDYQAKYTVGMSDEITPAAISRETAQTLNEMTRKIYKACDCRGVVRIDFIIKQSDGVPCMIEVNSIPGMSSGSIVPKQIAAMGMTMDELYDIIISQTYKERV